MTKKNESQSALRTSSGPYRSQQSHEAILAAAEALLSEGGPGAMTFESVARRARAGKTTLYRWWPNKSALLLEIYERQKRRVISDVDSGSLRGDLKALTRALWGFWRINNAGAAFGALIAEAQLSKESQTVLADYFNRSDAGMSFLCFERALKRGEISNSSDIAACRKAYVAMNWFHLLCGKLDDNEIDSAVDMLIDGMISRRD